MASEYIKQINEFLTTHTMTSDEYEVIMSILVYFYTEDYEMIIECIEELR